MNMTDVLHEIVGIPPLGFEGIEYIALLLIFIMFLRSIIIFFSMAFKIFKI